MFFWCQFTVYWVSATFLMWIYSLFSGQSCVYSSLQMGQFTCTFLLWCFYLKHLPVQCAQSSAGFSHQNADVQVLTQNSCDFRWPLECLLTCWSVSLFFNLFCPILWEKKKWLLLSSGSNHQCRSWITVHTVTCVRAPCWFTHMWDLL